MNFSCHECGKTFSNTCNLRRHLKKKHPDQLSVTAPKRIRATLVTCEECRRPFSKAASLKTHVRKFHPDKLEDLFPTKTYNHECEICHKHFTHLRHLTFHQRNIHQEVDPLKITVVSLKCPMCDYQATKVNLRRHFSTIHNIPVEEEKFIFSSAEEFNSWKQLKETKTQSFFVKNHGSHVTLSCVKTKYMCHRSGTFKTKGKGMRYLKVQGSNKINGYCPAGFLLSVKDQLHEVMYTKTHVGHECDLNHLSLTAHQRHQLATKIASKIPLPDILDEVRNSLSNCELERIHLLKKKDLYNIKQCFNLSVRRKNDAVSVEAGVKEESEVLNLKDEKQELVDQFSL